jgi:hypothetical protein
MKTWALLFLAAACLRAATISDTVGSAFGTGGKTITQPGTISYSAPGANVTASVNFGGASADANSNCGFMIDCSASAMASFSDAITIFGTSGILRAGINVQSGQDAGRGDSIFKFGSLVGASLGNQFDLLPACIFTVSRQQDFTAGIPTAISGRISVTASDTRPQDPFDGSSYAHATVGFDFFSVLSSAGQPISGFQYTSDSGTDYHVAGGTFFVSEPGTGWLLLAVLIASSLAAKAAMMRTTTTITTTATQFTSGSVGCLPD